MGTRAQFFIGNPQDLDKREWLGTIAWDGYPNGYCGEVFKDVKSVEEFRAAVEKIAKEFDHFGAPPKNSFPFPWRDDLFLTDYTYAFFDDKMQVTRFHRGWRPISDFVTPGLRAYPEDGDDNSPPDELPDNVPAPANEGKPAPDSIIVLTA